MIRAVAVVAVGAMVVAAAWRDPARTPLSSVVAPPTTVLRPSVAWGCTPDVRAGPSGDVTCRAAAGVGVTGWWWEFDSGDLSAGPLTQAPRDAGQVRLWLVTTVGSEAQEWRNIVHPALSDLDAPTEVG